MKLRDVTVSEFKARAAAEGCKLAVYGFGVIGETVAPFFLENAGLGPRVLCYVDADEKKQGLHASAAGRAIFVRAPEHMLSLDERFVILLTASRCSGILAWMERAPALTDTEVYILPQMLAKDCAHAPPFAVRRESDAPLIPRTLHYCWFGGKPIPPQLRRYMESWERFCPGYEIVRWDESNYDLSRYPCAKQAHDAGKWAFAADVVKLDVLFRYGGLYLDTDVELLRSPDALLYQRGFCCVEKWGVVNLGGGCGAVPGHPLIRKMLDARAGVDFRNAASSGLYETLPCLADGFAPDNTLQVVDGMTIYPSALFHPYDYMSRECHITENTFGIHHFWGSWL